jgi:SH3 domain protein
MDAFTTRIALGLTMILCSAAAHAETVYVQDSLRIGVRTEPGNSATPVGVVVTGMRLEVTDRTNDFVRIRTDKGLEGWIKESYVGKEKPAIIRLEELSQEHAKLKASIGNHGELLEKSESQNKSLSDALSDAKQQNTELQLALNKAQDQHRQSAWTYIAYVLSYVLIAIAGVVGGILWHRHQAMKRLGGLRV